MTKAMPLEDYVSQVVEMAGAILAEGNEMPVGDHVPDLEWDHTHGYSVQTAALNLVGHLRSMRLGRRECDDRAPFDRQEERVMDYMRAFSVGLGMDPIGFLIVSHGYIRNQLSEANEHVRQLRAQVIGAGMVPAMSQDEVHALDCRANEAYTQAAGQVFETPMLEQHEDDAATVVRIPVSSPPLNDMSMGQLLVLENRIHELVRIVDPVLHGRVAFVYDGAPAPRP